ncbi:predicted protein [Verticillium alfalfae VaMs.102]|uniref:Predicted protein n=1 Tax=Verticillium alfalfae (strain VaMs.102 / ATCC MYA-4576 / FGSC 10136) TaxID=526221 RepID=C9SRM7_VERA1|nr:predicted protein [Verticillium alfalfae VaMs.102]EEY21442.1 predicted protein [Verticillium alfalfae VaMs.102]
MIKFFFTELNITKGLYSPRRHNSRNNLLKCLITLGFDPSESPAPAARFWPRPSLVKIGGKHAGADPFSLEHLAILCHLSPGFAEMTPLHEAVLLGADGLVETRTSRSPANERNFLDQTPLHLALSNIRHMTALISSGHDVNALDRLGMTPLMYAGIMGLVDAVLWLLDRGADASLRDTKHKKLFIDFAASRNNWDVIMAALSKLETRSDNDTGWTWARHATILRHVEFPDHTRLRLGFKDFLAMCDTPNFIFDHNGRRGNTLMHFVITPEEVQTLLDQGFTRVNQANSDGHTPFMRSLRRHRELPTILPILNAGTDIHHRDNNGHTALWYALYMGTFQMANCSHDNGWRTLHHLLQCGIDALSLDNCVCPCSSNGCFPSGILHWSSLYYSQPTDIPRPLFEWLIVVLEYRGSEEAKTILLSYIRRAKHDELGLTHLCCTRFPGNPPMDGHMPPLPSDDVDDILTEEEELIDLMEKEMEEAKALKYDQLREIWFTQVKERLDAARADEVWAKPGKIKEQPPETVGTNKGSPIFDI